MTVGNSAIVLGLWPAHAVWAYFCILRWFVWLIVQLNLLAFLTIVFMVMCNDWVFNILVLVLND